MIRELAVAVAAAIALQSSFDSDQATVAQDRPFDSARGGAAGVAQDRPFDSAEGTPLGVAQDRQPPIFRARTDVVRLDVVVVDADGHAVHGLTKDDFEVIDRGRPQSVAAFDEISHTRVANPLPPTLKLDVADNDASRPDRLIILVLDDLHFQGKTEEVKAMARQVVTGIGPHASLALVTTSGVFGVEPTENRALLLAELDRFLDKFDPEGRRLARGARAPVGGAVPARGPADPASFFGDMTGFKTVKDVAKKIGVDAGRRNAFVWISGGMNAAVSSARCNGGPPELREPVPQLARPETSSRDDYYCSALADLLESLRKANATAYSIFTRDFGPGLLQDVADASGGFVMDATHFDRDLPRLIDDLDHYYLLGFYPEDTSDRKFHPVEVRVKKPGLFIVRYRHGYQPGNAAKPKNASPLARMAEGVLPVADLPLRLMATALPGDGRAVITLEVRADRRSIEEADGHLRDVLKYEVWAVDLRKKKASKSIAREARLDLNPAEAKAAAADPLAYQVNTMLALGPGKYQLRASALSARTKKGGSVFQEIEVPDPKRAPALGDIVIGFAAGPRVPIVRGGTGLSLLPLAPTLDREFDGEDTLRIVCDLVMRSIGEADLTMDLLAGSGRIVKRIATRRVSGAEPSRLDVTLALRDLPPGGYLLRVVAAGGTFSTRRDVGFVVK